VEDLERANQSYSLKESETLCLEAFKKEFRAQLLSIRNKELNRQGF
jgi:hypothetical protein